MSILIRGMAIPNTCKECVIGNPKNKTCYILGLPKRNLEVREDCPLVEVKEFHSDLIERKEVIKAARRADDDRISLSDSHIMSDAFEKEIKRIATIIEAEGSET